MNFRLLNSLIFKYSTDLNDPYPMDDEEINDAQQGVSNWQLEEGELQPEQGRAPQKGGPRKEMRIPGRKVPTKGEIRLKQKIFLN